MRIATFNVKNINKRFSNLSAWLRRAKPDVVCLQELKCTDAQFPADALSELGYVSSFAGARTGAAYFSCKAFDIAPSLDRVRSMQNPAA